MTSFPRFSRRTLVHSSALAAAGAALPLGRRARADAAGPHFFLMVCVSGGMDATYLFDARPLAMTDKNRQQNYAYKNPIASELIASPAPLLLTGTNGGKTLRSPLTEPLMPFQSDFTIVNGVTMLTNGFSGHGNNMYYLFTNAANGGGESFLPRIGARSLRPLESVHIGGWEGDGNGAPTNFSSSIQLYPGQGGDLAAALQSGPQLDLQSKLMKQVMARVNANADLGGGVGKFATGAKKMGSALTKAPALAQTLKSVTSGQTAGEMAGQLEIAMAYFKGGVTSAVTIMFDRDPVLDVHGSSSAQTQPTLIKGVVNELAYLLSKLKTTPFDEAAGLSFLDVTTVCITSEFSRTMIQSGAASDQTGTDHNPLTNSVILAGKGIKRGQVIGASDLTDVDASGNLQTVSAAHQQKDPSLTSIMGRPFDFESSTVRTDLPSTFVESDYISFNSIANTMMSLFGVPTQEQFRVGALTAPVVKGVLS
jgi:hypothetical protein